VSTAAILLVEDNDDDRELTMIALRDSQVANPTEIARVRSLTRGSTPA
jgi:hypothetical protein